MDGMNRRKFVALSIAGVTGTTGCLDSQNPKGNSTTNSRVASATTGVLGETTNSPKGGSLRVEVVENIQDSTREVSEADIEATSADVLTNAADEACRTGQKVERRLSGEQYDAVEYSFDSELGINSDRIYVTCDNSSILRITLMTLL
jgi:hypothetical protein